MNTRRQISSRKEVSDKYVCFLLTNVPCFHFHSITILDHHRASQTRYIITMMHQHKMMHLHHHLEILHIQKILQVC